MSQGMKFNPRVLDKIVYEHEVKTEKALAELIGVQPSTILRWRKGETSPNWEATARMVQLGIPWSEMASNEYVLAAAA